MRKLKLLFAACALMFGVGVQAQKDVTSQYITNATLSSLDGWTVSNFNTPVSGNGERNIAGDNNNEVSKNTVGYASEAYAGWDNLSITSYSMTQKITLPAGSYTLVNYSFFRQGQAYNTDNTKSLAYLKAGDNQVAIKTLGSINAASYANSQIEGAAAFDSKMYRNTLDFIIAADNTEIEIGLTGTFDVMRSWCIAGKFELIDKGTEATMDSPFDVTGYLTNPGFEYRNMEGWTLSEENAFGAQVNNSFDNKGGFYYAEKWQGSGGLSDRSMSQTLSDLPAGYYQLSAYVYYGGTGAYVSLGNGTTTKTTSVTASSSGKYSVGYVLADGDNLKVEAGLSGGTANWVCFDRFELKFCGDIAAALTTLCAKLTDYNGAIPTAAYNQLVTDVTAQNNTYTDADDYITAIAAVQNLYDAADLLKDNYAAWLTMKSYADALVAVENTNSEAHTTLSEAITAQNTAANAATAADDIATATSTLKTAMTTYVGAANPTSGNRFDCTFLMTNPDLTGLATWAAASGWASEESDGNSQVMVNDSKTQGDKSYFYEYWSAPAKASGNFALYNAVTLPAGTFSMSCYAFAEDQYNSSTVDGVYFYANDTQGSCVTATVLTEQTLSFINESEQEVKIGLKTLTGNTRNWMGIGYVKLYKEYTDNTTYDIVTESVNNGSVAVTVDGEAATSAKALKTVTLTYTPDDGYVMSSVVVSYNDGTNDVNLDVANPSENVYTFQMPAFNVTVTSTIVVDKTALATAIADATSARKSTNEGDGVFQIPASAGTTLATAIATAQGVYDNESATVANVGDAVTALNSAVSTYENAELNTPAANVRYNLMVATSGHAKNGNAVVIVPGTTSNNNPTGYGLNANFAPNANLNQAVTFTQVSGNNYNISFETAEGTTYLTYGTTNGSAAGWSGSQIQATTDASKKGEFKIAATTTDNVFNIYNTLTNSTIACQSVGNIYTETGNADFSVSVASQASITINTSAAGYGTLILPFAATLPTDVKAYTCAEVSGDQLTLIEADEVAANQAYIIEGSWNETKTGWGLGTALENKVGLLTGVYAATTAPAGSYVMQKNNDKVGFYKVVDGSQPTVGANRCYVTVPASEGARAAFFFNTEATGIEAIEALTNGEGQIFNASGAQLPKLQKGINIVRKADGKSYKVMVK